MASNQNVVLITDAAQGIGQAIAVKFTEAGYKVALFDIADSKRLRNYFKETEDDILTPYI
jgi:NADP-dependent 3-hydroxy acid dehydrogenase YdfG